MPIEEAKQASLITKQYQLTRRSFFMSLAAAGVVSALPKPVLAAIPAPVPKIQPSLAGVWAFDKPLTGKCFLPMISGSYNTKSTFAQMRRIDIVNLPEPTFYIEDKDVALSLVDNDTVRFEFTFSENLEKEGDICDIITFPPFDSVNELKEQDTTFVIRTYLPVPQMKTANKTLADGTKQIGNRLLINQLITCLGVDFSKYNFNDAAV